MSKIHYVFLLLVGMVLFAAILLMADESHRALLLGTDFRGIFTGPYMVHQGAGLHLYDLRAQFYWQHLFAPEVQTFRALLPFLNPAFVALFLVPLTFLSFPWAYVIWGGVNIGLLAALFFWSFRFFRKELSGVNNAATPLFLFIFSWIPFWVAVMQGQFSLILLLALCMGWSMYEKKRFFASGMWLALLFIRPHLVLVPVLMLFMGKQYKILRGLVCGIVGLVCTGLLVGGYTSTIEYAKTLLFAGRAGDTLAIHPAFEPTIKSLLHALYGTDQVTGPIVVLWCIAFAALCVCMYWKRRTIPINPHIQWALIPLVGILFSPHTNYHDLSLLFFSEVLVFKYCLSIPKIKEKLSKYSIFWVYVFVALHMVAFRIMMPFSAAMVAVILACTLLLLYFEGKSNRFETTTNCM